MKITDIRLQDAFEREKRVLGGQVAAASFQEQHGEHPNNPAERRGIGKDDKTACEMKSTLKRNTKELPTIVE